MISPTVTAFFDEPTNTVSYVVADPNGRVCAVIDPVLDYDAASGRTSTQSVDRIIEFVRQNDLQVSWILETHVHADHLSAGVGIRDELGGNLAIGAHITEVQEIFGELFNAGGDFARDGSQFDHLFRGGEEIDVGNVNGYALHTPGHTPACMTYVIGDAAFVGDTLFMPDYGTARADFPGGDAATLYQSIQRIYQLPEDTRMFVCHDYKAPGRADYQWESTVARQKAGNIHVHEGVTEAQFVAMREKRDKTLSLPRLILPSVQVNMRAGMMPAPEKNGRRYLKIPLNAI